MNVSFNQSLVTPGGAYNAVTGHNATENSAAAKLIGLAEVSVAIQQDEFVTWARGRRRRDNYAYSSFQVLLV